MSHDDILDRLMATILARKSADASSSYTASLFAKGTDAALKKVGEEATEFVLAAKHASVDASKTEYVTKEAADVIFHLLIALAQRGLTLNDVRAELVRREGLSGHDEKAARTK